MLNWNYLRRAIPTFAVGLGIGLLTCFGNTGAEEILASPAPSTEYKLASAAEYKIASVAPTEALHDSSSYRLSEPFGLGTSALVAGGIQNKWSGVTNSLPHEREVLMKCRTEVDTCPPAAKKFLAIVDTALSRSGRARIGEINREVNLAIRPVDDITQYGVPDLWATPLMTFSFGAGDCEDYAIAKYVALQEIGITVDDLRLVVVHDRMLDQDHAVTAVRFEGNWLILDNRTHILRKDVDIAAYSPMFVIDKEGVKRMMPWASIPQKLKASESATAEGLQITSAWQSTPLLM